jgi:hypothetical protein
MNKSLVSTNLVMAAFVAVLMAAPETVLADKPTYARARSAQIPGLGWADHTYTCYKGSSERCFSNMGGNSGGSKLDGSSGTGDTDMVSCVHDKGKNKGDICYQRYAIEAVCHQETDISLGDAGTTVYKAKGFSTSKKFFGTYGLNPNVSTCLKTCLSK